MWQALEALLQNGYRPKNLNEATTNKDGQSRHECDVNSVKTYREDEINT